jgi:glycosyltransferase involved in cell wall biosynthesis
MKICIPIEFFAQGGGFYFLKNFEDYLAAHAWEITRNVKDRYDILFTNHWMTPKVEILKGIRRNPFLIVVQRVDGAAQDYGRDIEADFRQHEINKLADLTIFQSEYTKYATREKFAVIEGNGPVIWNPVDINTFTPKGALIKPRKNRRVAVITWSTNPKKGVSNVYETAKLNPDIDFYLCGNFPEMPEYSNLIKMGVLNRLDLAKTLRSSQVLLTFSENEACPNHVLEALACGVPVLYKDSGAMKEVVGESGLAISASDFRTRFEEILIDHSGYSNGARKRALTYFDPNLVLPLYLKEMLETLRHPNRPRQILRLAKAWSTKC